MRHTVRECNGLTFQHRVACLLSFAACILSSISRAAVSVVPFEVSLGWALVHAVHSHLYQSFKMSQM